MLTVCAIVFFVIGWRAGLLSRKHFLWIAAVAIIGVLSSSETARHAALMRGNQFVYSPLMFLGAWLYSSCFMTVALLIGAWLGSRWGAGQEKS